jgi:hypothetical protein
MVHSVKSFLRLDSLFTSRASTLLSVEDRVQRAPQVLTDVVAGEMLKIPPSGFNLECLPFSFELSGKPGGIGVEGTVGVTFEKQ